MTIEFQAWPKTPRLFRDMIITEKLDGTNAAVVIEQVTGYQIDTPLWGGEPDCFEVDGGAYRIGAQSRKRLIYPGADNFGFAGWVRENAVELIRALGVGRHFGEWWGHGIQRGYGLKQGDRRFSLFNVERYAGLTSDLPGLGVVPSLCRYAFDTRQVENTLAFLRENGSAAAPGFMQPEGVIVFQTAASQVFKALIENDDQPKGLNQ
ncbi:RNA ligase family protein [Catenuloplanes sp. NPDC051500]|uniref:RNA ligase family protein n=1 Tax=Catenuloplanes sp. NPDC051500 TaxID=3363959 RepID=UPI0037AF0BE3